MKLKKNQVVEIADRLDAVCRRLRKEEKKFREAVEGVHPLFRKSARNLVHYYLLRSGEEVRHIQNDLAQLGFCGMGDLEGHVLDGLMTTRDMLRRLVGLKDAGGKAPVTRREAERIFRGHTMALFGKKIKGSPTRIMVTLPSEAAEQHNLVRRYAEAGMNVARINCAHDGPGDWQKMAAHVRRARKKTGRNCRVAMDLGGPKIRTGSLEEGPRVLHLHPERDVLGRVVAPARAVFLAEGATARDGEAAVQVNGQFVGQAKRGDSLCFVDARGKRCRFAVSAVEDGRVAVDFPETVYLLEGTPVYVEREGKRIAASVAAGIPPLDRRIVLHAGDRLLLSTDGAPGTPAEYDAEGGCLRLARVPCTAPEILDDLAVGDPILFDDGKIEGEVESKEEGGAVVHILGTRGDMVKLGADKGINLPATRLRISGLTDKDRTDLAAMAGKVDIVNMSFVNTPDDVLALLQALKDCEAKKTGVILKIETRQGYENLPAILLAAMRHPALGVMLARGDLAVECGWENLAPVQEEILRLCNAAHVPVVWATQVLETYAQKGIPTRAEITDAAVAERAECVMLNKGPHIHKTITLLERILTDMRKLRRKAETQLGPLSRFDFGKKPKKEEKPKKEAKPRKEARPKKEAGPKREGPAGKERKARKEPKEGAHRPEAGADGKPPAARGTSVKRKKS